MFAAMTERPVCPSHSHLSRRKEIYNNLILYRFCARSLSIVPVQGGINGFYQNSRAMEDFFKVSNKN